MGKEAGKKKAPKHVHLNVSTRVWEEGGEGLSKKGLTRDGGAASKKKNVTNVAGETKQRRVLLGEHHKDSDGSQSSLKKKYWMELGRELRNAV